MSMNLTLTDDVAGCRFELYQTPTNATYSILEGKTRQDILDRYMEWWKKGRLNKQGKLDKWDKEEYLEHKAKIEKFLAGHVNAKWGLQ